ncbi:unnamed protein product [Prunus armeniaca]
MDAIPAIPRVPRSQPNPSVSMTTNSLFVSPEAATFYQEVVSKRKFVVERSYTLDALPTKAWCDTSQLFTHYKLHTLNVLSRKFNASAIKEFYSNLPVDPQVTNFCVFVRNVPLIIRPSLINRTLGFRSYPGLDYAQFSVALSQYTIASFRTVASPFFLLPRHEGTLVFPYLLHLLCEKSQVPSTASDLWQPSLVPYGKASIAMSQKVPKTLLTTVSSIPSSSESDELRK